VLACRPGGESECDGLSQEKDQQVTHTHTPTENNTADADTHTHDKNNTPNPQTNISHKHSTTLEGGATTVRATACYRRKKTIHIEPP